MRKAKGLKLEKFVRLQFEVLSLGAYQSPNSEPESEKPKSRTRLYYY